jgi:hypothetical protein
MPDNLRSIFMQFVQQPNAETYRKLHALVTSQPSYDPYGNELNQVEEFLSRQDYAEAKKRLSDMMVTWLISPTVHMLAGFVAAKLGDTPACMQGILATGDGTDNKPYLVSRVRDEYEVIRFLGKTSAAQAAVSHGNLFLDSHTCSDGSSIHFDVTALKRKLDQQFKPRN